LAASGNFILKGTMKSVAIALLSLACVSARATDFTFTYTTPSLVSTTFECGGGQTGHCYYLIMTSACKETILPTGQKQRVCQVSPFIDFTLVRGERKLVSNLPSDYQYCMKMDAKPSLAECIANPLPH
jgi:hypothetical protein